MISLNIENFDIGLHMIKKYRLANTIERLLSKDCFRD